MRPSTRRSQIVYDNDPLDPSGNEKVSDESCRENRGTKSTSNTFLSEKSVIYKITTKNTAELG
jgi:hypothetical protein